MARVFYVYEIISKDLYKTELEVVITADYIEEVVEELSFMGLMPTDNQVSSISYIPAEDMIHLQEIIESDQRRRFEKLYPELPF